MSDLKTPRPKTGAVPIDAEVAKPHPEDAALAERAEEAAKEESAARDKGTEFKSKLRPRAVDPGKPASDS